MLPHPEFNNRPKDFWAHVRSLSQRIGYVERVRRREGAERQVGPIKIPTLAEMTAALEAIGASTDHVVGERARPTSFGKKLLEYFEYRAHVLNAFAEPHLMDVDRARKLFQSLQRRLKSNRSVPLNKQGKEKKKPAYFTGMVNMLIEATINGLPCDYDPRELTTVTKNTKPFRTLARRIDGAFPSPVNPIAVWQIKEYYYTTTFGSRVADAVYETLLDGMELEELRTDTKGKIDVKHYLMIDAHYTWWIKGRSYLCRIIDLLHMGYVDEVLFGSEIVDRLPQIAKGWIAVYESTEEWGR